MHMPLVKEPQQENSAAISLPHQSDKLYLNHELNISSQFPLKYDICMHISRLVVICGNQGCGYLCYFALMTIQSWFVGITEIERDTRHDHLPGRLKLLLPLSWSCVPRDRGYDDNR